MGRRRASLTMTCSRRIVLVHGMTGSVAVDGASHAPGTGASRWLVLEGIHHAYDAAPVVKGVDLVVGPGDIMCLLGPSGCGKTTLLRIAAGLERPRQGRVLIDGEEVAGPHSFVAPEKRRIGLMFQDYALFPHVRAIDNVGFGLKGVPRAERRRVALRMLERLGLADLAHAYPHELSGGEQQRVALARALAPAPRAMLLDEPFSGLDERLREQVRDDTLRFLNEAGVPIVLVTHDAEEALLMADQIALMRDGVLVQVGSPDELCRKPASPFVARFFGALPPFDGRVQDRAVETPIGRAPTGCSEGCKVRVYVRPEAVVLVDDAASDADGLPFARVIDSRTLGSTSHLRLAIDGHGAPLTLSVGDAAAPRIDDRVRIRLDPRRTFVFPATQDL